MATHGKTPQTIVIVGAGLAGATAARTLRPYERPPLSKAYLRGEADRDSVYVRPRSFYAEHEIELRTGTYVENLGTSDSEVVLAGGERLPYDALLIATGARPRRLTLPGAHLDGVHELRTIADSEALAEPLRDGARLAVVGAGWIGCEVAASASQKGVDVTVVEPLSVPLERVLGRQHVTEPIQALIRSRAAIDQRLADPDTPLTDLLPATAQSR